MRSVSTLAGFLLGALAGAGCGEGVPEHIEVEVGFLDDSGVYEPLGPGDACSIVKPLQTGYWSMPTIRAYGGRAGDVVGCSIYDFELDVQLGSASSSSALQKGDGPYAEAAPFQIYLPKVDHELFDELEGHPGEIDCYVRNSRVEAHTTLDVVLTTDNVFEDL